jgi:hypothetical protein
VARFYVRRGQASVAQEHERAARERQEAVVRARRVGAPGSRRRQRFLNDTLSDSGA